ncbi:MAG: DUF86 domain-containing protein [Acidobacteriota bacterium]
MPRRDPDLLVEGMLVAVRKIEVYTAGLDQAAFVQDEKTIDAVVRNLEVLGEAARQLPVDFTLRHADIPWNQIAGLRNRVIHEYFGLDLEIIWQIIRHDLPQLKAQLEKFV